MRNSRNFYRKSKFKRQLDRPWCRRKYIKIILRATEHEVRDWISYILNTMMNVRVP